MAKKIEKPEVKEVETTGTENVEMNNVAFSIVKTGEKKHSVIKVSFNLDEKVAGNVEILVKDVDIFEAQHEFRMAVIRAGLFG